MTDKEKIRAEIERRARILSGTHAGRISDTLQVLEELLSFIDSLQEEPETKFKIGDRIRLKGTTVKGDTIIKIYTSEVGNTYFEFKNSDIASADLDWELVEEPKKCMFTKEEFTEEDRKILCEDCEEECEYAKKEEPVSEDLGEYINELSKQFPEVSFAKLSRIAVRVAKWQKQQDQSTIELAEDHDMLAGMEKMKEEMMAKAIEVTVHIDAGGYPYIPQIELYDYDKDVPLAKEGDKYKVVLIKED